MANEFKLSIELEDREVFMSVNSGITATMEMGAYDGKVESPVEKLVVVANTLDGEKVAWIQRLRANTSGNFEVTHEGWAKESEPKVRGVSNEGALTVVWMEPNKFEKSAAEISSGAASYPTACCTSYSGSCYVTCCGGCCSDPYRCPGASCCP